MSKNTKNNNGVVYSTNPDFVFEEETPTETLLPEKQNLKVLLDKKARAGKKVTLVEGFVGDNEALTDLAKLLKNKCGVGGSAKDGQIIIQGDFREKILEILHKEKYKAK